MALFENKNISNFFLNQENPYSKKRTIKIGHVAIVFAVIGLLIIVAGSAIEQRENEMRAAAQAVRDAKNSSTLPPGSIPQTQDQGFVSLSAGFNGFTPKAHSTTQKQISASQIIKRGEFSADALPIGSQIAVQLVGKVESTDANSPVTAVLLQDALSPVQALVIPKGARIIGNGQLDVNRERLQVRFHTLVLPEGQQYSLSGLAMMQDGSSGLEGDYSSGQLKRNASQFLGNFIGGVAEGMKDKTTTGQLGIPVEPGNIRNGLLNGVAQSSLNYAKFSSEQMGQTRASIIVKDGTRFILYLEREFHQ